MGAGPAGWRVGGLLHVILREIRDKKAILARGNL